MILERDEEKILEKLLTEKEGSWTVGALEGFFSGAQLMQAIRSLDAKGLVDFRDGIVSLTAIGRAQLDHPKGRLSRKAAGLAAIGKTVYRPLISLTIFVGGFIAGFVADNIAPRVYCSWLPNSGAWLTPCEELQGENK